MLKEKRAAISDHTKQSNRLQIERNVEEVGICLQLNSH